MNMSNVFDFVRCQRADGSHYGTAGKCLKGREVEALLRGDKNVLGGAKLLGEGGFGKAYELEGGVVVKVGEVYKNEIEVMQKIDGMEGVPRLLGHGKGVVVMSKVEGQDLRRWGDKMGDASAYVKGMEKALNVVKQLHQKGVAHNDLNRGNIVWDGKDKVSVIDFGVSSLGHKDALKEIRRLGNDLRYRYGNFIRAGGSKKSDYPNIEGFLQGLSAADDDDIDFYDSDLSESVAKGLVDKVWAKVGVSSK